MANRKFSLLAAAITLAVYVVSAQAQLCHEWPTVQSGNRIGNAFTVSKLPDCNGGETALFSTIQDAVNFVPAGSIIQIMDTSTYAEQVTIDGQGASGQWYHWLQRNRGIGRDTISASPKSRITIIWIPSNGWPAEGAHTYSGGRPTIRYQDTYNNRPQNDADINNSCDLPSGCRTVCEAINGPGSLLCARTTDTGGGAGNFENNGALRLIRTSGVVIDGLRISGGGIWTRTANIWGGPQFYGNAAVTISGSGSITIRNSEITGATNGIAVKDRNIGGVFANKNEHDLDESTPLGNFGAMGDHIIEYNRIHGNRRGIFFESGWDLGLYIRHNLIFNNNNTNVPATGTVPNDLEAARTGGIYVRDHIFQPVAIHNNTFYNNGANFNGGWQIGAPHLIYNNIYGAVLQDQAGEITGLHRNRLHNSVFSASQFQTQGGQGSHFTWREWDVNNPSGATAWPADLRALSSAELQLAYNECRNRHGTDFQRPGPVSIQNMGYYNELIAAPAATGTDSLYAPHLAASNTFTTTSGVGPYPCRIFISNYEGTATNPADLRVPALGNSVTPGTVLGTPLPASGNNKFLQMEGHLGAGYPVLFASVNPNDPNFLVPIWLNPSVSEHVAGQGWGAVNNGNRNGAFDIGAIQSPRVRGDRNLNAFTGSRADYRVHLRPTNVVMVDTNTREATVNFQLDVHDVTDPGRRRTVRMENPTITHLRWVEPLPHRREVFPGGGAEPQSMIVGLAAHTTITPPAVTINSNANTMFTFQVPRIPGGPGTRDSVGAFLEIVVSGTIDGRQVSSNVGFLPYRLITHRVEVCVLPENHTLSTPDALLGLERSQCLTEVIAGEPYQLKIVPTRPDGAAGQVVFRENVEHVDFRLNSGGDHAFIWCHPTGQPSQGMGTGSADYMQVCPQTDIGGATGNQPGDFVQSFVGGRNETYMASDRHIRAGARYRIFFSYSADEQIFVTAQTRIHGTNTAFLGTTNIRVLPAAPSQISFIDPVPLWQLSASGTGPTNIGECSMPGPRGPNFEPLPDGCIRAQLIVRGTKNEVITEVQDRFGNATDRSIPVTIEPDASGIGEACAFVTGAHSLCARPMNQVVNTIGGPLAWDHPDRGRAIFEAHAVSGETNQYFDMTASAAFLSSQFSDVGRLRLGRALNQLRIFFDDNEPNNTSWPLYYDPSVVIDGTAVPGGENRHQITVKTATPTDVVTTESGWVQIVPTSGTNHESLRFFANQLTDTPTNTFQVVNGEVTFWVGVDATSNLMEDIVGACVRASYFNDQGAQLPNTNFSADTRCGITLRVPSAGIAFAEVLGDGEGRPDRIRLGLMGGDIPPSAYDDMIQGVRLVWPPELQAGMPAAGANIYEITRANGASRFAATTETASGYEMIINIAGLTAGGLEAIPLPTGRTSISGTGMGVVAVMTGDADAWNSNFNTHDGIGPIIASADDNITNLMGPLVIENTCRNQGGADCPNDVLLIQVSEGVRATATNFVLPGTFELARVPVGQVPTALTTGETLIVTSATASGSPNGSRLELAPTSPAPRLESVPATHDYYLRFVPEASHVEDFAQSAPNKPDNNNPHAQNRWVKIELRPEPPKRNDGWYTASVVTGLLDTGTVVFDKVIEPGWLRGAMVEMDTDSREITQEDIEAGRVVFAGDTVKFCLATFFPSRSTSTITTSGRFNLRIVYSFENPATREWNGTDGGVDHALEDRAKPVIANPDPAARENVAARIIFGVAEQGVAPENIRDTIVVWTSEVIENIAAVGRPLRFVTNATDELALTPELRLISEGVAMGTSYRELRYEFVDGDAVTNLMLGRRLAADGVTILPDSVRINAGALPSSLTDAFENVQDQANNRAVRLTIVRPENWTVVPRCSPPVGPECVGEDVEVIATPIDNPPNNMRMRAEIELYDNVGNLVRRWSTCELYRPDPNSRDGRPAIPVVCDADGWATNVPGLIWRWDGQNARGRVAGTGTYLYRARYFAEIPGEEPIRRNVSQPIGFIRY